MSEISFTKMHGLGNDFVVLSEPLDLSESQISKLCDRNFGIGADGLLVVTKHDDNIKMKYWNADGSKAEMCGNGLRCVVRYAVENKFVNPGQFIVETDAGNLSVNWDGVDPAKIDVQLGKVTFSKEPVSVHGESFYIATVGNPHAITFTPDIQGAPVKELGPKVETDSYFPDKTNVEFAQIADEKTIKLRVWERGVGETLACGTGMVATAITSQGLGKSQLPVNVQVPGGSAEVNVDNEGYARIKGPAENVFRGTINMENLVE